MVENVLIVSNMWPSSGSFGGIFVKEQVDALRARGLRVTVELVGQHRRLNYLTDAFGVRRAVRSAMPDVVHAHFGLSAVPCQLLPRSMPLVVTLHGSDVNRTSLRLISRVALRRADAVIFVSHRLKQRLRTAAPIVEVVPNGVDTKLFVPDGQASARAALGLSPTNSPIVLFAGARANAVKRYDRFCAVVQQLRLVWPDLQELVLVDGDPSRETVLAKMRAADCLIFTSDEGSEGSPMVVKEALAVGLPVISVDVGDVSSIVAHDELSRVVPWPAPRAESALVACIAASAVETLQKRPRRVEAKLPAGLASAVVADSVARIYAAAVARRATTSTKRR